MVIIPPLKTTYYRNIDEPNLENQSHMYSKALSIDHLLRMAATVLVETPTNPPLTYGVSRFDG